MDGTGKTGVGLAFFDAVEIGEEELQAASAEADEESAPHTKDDATMFTLLANDDAVTYHRNQNTGSVRYGVFTFGAVAIPRERSVPRNAWR